MTRTYKRVEERHYSAHHTLLHIAEQSLQKAVATEPGWFNEAFICITFSSLSVEAMANAIGSKVITDWKDFESASPTAKLRLIAEHLDISFNLNEEPWSTIKWLAKFRNQVAHPKPEHVISEQIIEEKDRSNTSFEPPESKFEKSITVENARRAFETVQKVKRQLCANLPLEDIIGLDTDGWSSSTEPNGLY